MKKWLSLDDSIKISIEEWILSLRNWNTLGELGRKEELEVETKDELIVGVGYAYTKGCKVLNELAKKATSSRNLREA